MKTLLGLTFLFVTTNAFAQPAPVFPKTTSFESCTKGWAFACGMRDSQGRRFGTAKEVSRCTKYELAPNGTYTINGGFGTIGGDRGTYRVIGTTVRITPIGDDGKPGKAYDLTLSPDGSKLGEMNRL